MSIFPVNQETESVMAARRPSNPEPRRLSPRFTLGAVVLAVWLTLAQAPSISLLLGLRDYGRWFLDSYAVLASNDALAAGIAPEAPNPYDPFGRSHKYSDWWFVLGHCGLTRGDNFIVGLSWVAAFFAASLICSRPRSHREAIWLAMVLSSPPVFSGVMRANNDLVVFAVLAIAVVALRAQTFLRLTLAVMAVAVATGLKFYPLVGGAVFFLVRPADKLRRTLVACAIAAGAALFTVINQVQRGMFSIPLSVHLFGGRTLFLDFGFGDRSAAVATAGLFLMLVGAIVWRGWLRNSLTTLDESGEAASFAIGAATLAGCFIAGQSFGYRWIFAAMIAPWLWRQATGNVSPPARVAARSALWLLTASLWCDGALCAVANLFLVPLSADRLEHVERTIRLVSQAVSWPLMVLLGAWLGEAMLSAARTLRADFFERHPKSA